MNAARLVAAARLWDEEEVARQAVGWVQGEGKPFLSLSPSQVAALLRAGAGVRTGAEFRESVMAFVEKQCNKKRPGIWTRLREPLGQGLDEVRRALEAGSAGSEAFFACQRILRRGTEARPGAWWGERELAAARAWLGLLARCHRGGAFME